MMNRIINHRFERKFAQCRRFVWGRDWSAMKISSLVQTMLVIEWFHLDGDIYFDWKKKKSNDQWSMDAEEKTIISKEEDVSRWRSTDSQIQSNRVSLDIVQDPQCCPLLPTKSIHEETLPIWIENNATIHRFRRKTSLPVRSTKKKKNEDEQWKTRNAPRKSMRISLIFFSIRKWQKFSFQIIQWFEKSNRSIYNNRSKYQSMEKRKAMEIFGQTFTF